MFDFHSKPRNAFASKFTHSLPKIYPSLQFASEYSDSKGSVCRESIHFSGEDNVTMNFDNSGPVINESNPSIGWNTDSGLSFDSSLKKDYSLTYGDGWMPSAPSPGLVLFNSEEQSDLIFIVTMDSNHDKDDLKFPGHSFIIKDSSPIFKDIIHELNQRQNNSDQKPIINIQCRPETLHMLMR